MNNEQWIRQLNTTVNTKIEVMKDIIDFKTSKKKALSLLTKKTNNIITVDIRSITNDIYGYLNESNAIINGCVPKFYNTFRRLFKNKTKNKKDIILFFLKIMKGNEYTELNILWGLLTPNERNIFLQSVH